MQDMDLSRSTSNVWRESLSTHYILQDYRVTPTACTTSIRIRSATQFIPKKLHELRMITIDGPDKPNFKRGQAIAGHFGSGDYKSKQFKQLLDECGIEWWNVSWRYIASRLG